MENAAKCIRGITQENLFGYEVEAAIKLNSQDNWNPANAMRPINTKRATISHWYFFTKC